MDRDDVVEIGEEVDLDAPAGETLVQGGGRPRRRWTTPVLVAVAALAVALLLADRSQREREVGALVDDVVAASAAVDRADQRITAMQLYIRPVAASGASVSGLAADLDGLVADAAAQGAEEVGLRREQVDDATVLDTQVERLGDARVSDQPTEDRALAELTAALRAVAPSGEAGERLESALRALPGGRATP
jgi:hypothetical protein